MSTIAKPKIALKKLKELDTVWHPDTALVFKSSQDKVVYGRWINDELVALDDEAIILCEKWSFKYDTSYGDGGSNDGGDTESKEDEEEIESKEEDEEEIVTENIIPKIKSSSSNLDNITTEFTKNLNFYFQSVNNDFSNKISILETQLSNKTKDYNDMKEERDKLKAKFEGIKNFFT